MKSTIPRCARLYTSVQFLYASACTYMHNYTLHVQEDSNSDSDERAKQKKLEKPKQEKKKDDNDKNPEVCTSVQFLYASACICLHLLASACICMHLYALNTLQFYITTALEALREPVLSRKCGSSSSRVTSREAGLVIYVSSSRLV